MLRDSPSGAPKGQLETARAYDEGAGAGHKWGGERLNLESNSLNH